MTLRPIHIWIKAALKGCGASELAVLPPQQLLDCIDAEVSVAETVHGWGDLGYQNELGKDSDFLYNLWQVPLLAPAAGALTMHDNEGHDCYSLTDILRVNASICTQYGWEMSKAGTFPQIPVCKWQSASSMCVNTVPAGLEAVETGLYGFPKFKVRGAPSNFEEASGRFIYAAHNIQRLDTGSSGVFGGIGMVFRPSFVRNTTQFAPTDTGLYAGCLLQADPELIEPSGIAICAREASATSCNYRANCDWVAGANGTHTCEDLFCPHWTLRADCTKYAAIGCGWHPLKRACEQIAAAGGSEDAVKLPSATRLAGRRLGAASGGPPWSTPPTLGCGSWGDAPLFPTGTLDDFHHLFLPNARAWAHENTTGAKSQTELGSRLCRLFNPSGAEVSGIGTLHYWEAAVGATPLYPDAIKMVIGDFAGLFGTPLGQTLRDWCVQRGWVLVWALGAAGQNVQAEWFGQPPIYALFNQRMLDPIALAATSVGNVSALTTPAVRSHFGELWGFVENYRSSHPPPPPTPGDPVPPPEFNATVFTYWFEKQPPGLLVKQLKGADKLACGGGAGVEDRCVGTLASDGRCVCYST